MDWSSTGSILRALTVPGAILAAAVAAVELALFSALARRRLAREESAGGVLAFALGAAVFVPSITEVQAPLQALANRWAMGHLTTANSLILSVPAILLTGVVQEPAKLLAAALGLLATRRARARAAGMIGALAGAGYGAMEAAIVLSYAFARSPVGAFPWPATIERASVVILHLSLPAVVMFWWTRGASRGLVALAGAVLAHAAVDYLTVLFAVGLVGVGAVEGLIALVSLALFAHAVFLSRGARYGG